MYRVTLRYQASYTLSEVRKALEDILSASWTPASRPKRGDRVLLKPNLLSGKPPSAAVTTHPVVVEAMIQILLDAGYRVTVGDSPALQKFATVVKKAGLQALGSRYPIRLQDLDSPVPVAGPPGGIYKTFEISRHCLETDALINLAKFKTHSMMGLTLCVKNLFGCIPGKRKAGWHLSIGKNRDLFARMLVELGTILPARFHVLDGIMAMEGNGPGNGTPTPLRVLLGGENAAAVDATAARLVGLPPGDLPTCVGSAKLHAGPRDEREITLTGDGLPPSPAPFTFPETMPTDWHLPGPLKGLLRWVFLPLPKINPAVCRGCLDCREVCPPGAIYEMDGNVRVRKNRCIRCYCCQEVCPADAITFKKGLFPI